MELQVEIINDEESQSAADQTCEWRMWTGAVVQLGSSSRPGTRNTFQNKFLLSLHSIIIIMLLLALQNNFQGIFSRGKSLTVSERHIWMVHGRTDGRRMGQAEVVTIAFATIKSAWPGGGQERGKREVDGWREETRVYFVISRGGMCTNGIQRMLNIIIIIISTLLHTYYVLEGEIILLK